MTWALIATIQQPLVVWIPGIGEFPLGMPGYWSTITAQPGTVINLVVYDGISPYSPPEGTELQVVPDGTQIGDTGF